eukprot:g35731.t1
MIASTGTLSTGISMTMSRRALTSYQGGARSLTDFLSSLQLSSPFSPVSFARASWPVPLAVLVLTLTRPDSVSSSPYSSPSFLFLPPVWSSMDMAFALSSMDMAFAEASSWVICISTTVIWLIFVPLLLSKSNVFPMDGRFPALVAIQDVLEGIWVAFFLGLFFTKTVGDLVPCSVSLWGHSILFNLIMSLYCLRAVLLLFRLEVTKDANLPDAQEPKRAKSRARWFTQHQKLVSTKYICGYAIAILLISSIVPIWATAALGGLNESCRVIPAHLRVAFACIPLFAISVEAPFLLLVLSFISWKTPDAYHLKAELSFSLGVFGLGAGLFVLLLFLNIPSNLTLWLASLAIFSANTIYPLYLIWTYAVPHNKFEKGPSKATLEGILQHPPTREVFLQYLQTEFNSQLLLYWDRVNMLQSTAESLLEAGGDRNELKKLLDKTYMEYLQPNNAYYPVAKRLDKELYKAIVAAFETLHSAEVDKELLRLLVESQDQVFSYLEAGPFKRFRATPPADKVLVAAYLPWKLSMETKGELSSKPLTKQSQSSLSSLPAISPSESDGPRASSGEPALYNSLTDGLVVVDSPSITDLDDTDVASGAPTPGDTCGATIPKATLTPNYPASSQKQFTFPPDHGEAMASV